MEEKKRAINWYPGHMTKARRMMEEDIKLVDLVIEIVDARIPLSSRNPDIDKLAKNKARIVLLNKSDLADDTVTDEWITYFKDKGFYCLKLNSRLNVSNRAVNNLITVACSAKIERDRARGIKNRSIKAMIVGIPNVGKSTFINSFTGRKSAKTGNKPGVTKGKQWIRINGSVELLDTPGILWPKIEDRNVGERLAMIGSINDQILNIEELALETIKFLRKNYQPQLYSRYDITEDIFDNVDTETMMNPENAAALCIMEHIARKRGCIKKGSDIDYEKCAACILDDFKAEEMTKVNEYMQMIVAQAICKEITKDEMKQLIEEMYDTFSYICGIDEAGRGPLAGPVVAGAVILPKGKRILYVNDSKKLSEKKRDELFDVIKEEALSYGIGIVSPERIDEINI
mgnify:CR=1 FL=1